MHSGEGSRLGTAHNGEELSIRDRRNGGGSSDGEDSRDGRGSRRGAGNKGSVLGGNNMRRKRNRKRSTNAIPMLYIRMGSVKVDTSLFFVNKLSP